ncbi:MAG: GNAT family N-acetyltransferase [Patescibacteria group bacterium]
MNKVLLKKATWRDLKEIADIEKEAQSKTYSALINDVELKNFINKEFVFLIKRQNIVLGLIAYKIVKKNVVYLDGLVVRKKFRREGVAKRAVNIVLKRVSKYSRIELLVHPNNNPALCLYLPLGFFIESWKDNYFGDGEPRLMLVKK